MTSIESVSNGLGGAAGEVLGGVFTLLISIAALHSGALPRLLNYLGCLVGAIGLLSAAPGLHDIAAAFGIAQVIWFVWTGAVLLREHAADGVSS